MKGISLEILRLVAAAIAGGAVALCLRSSKCERPSTPDGQTVTPIVSGGWVDSTGKQGSLVPVAVVGNRASDSFAAGSSGATIMVLCRGVDSGACGALFWREFTISADGRVLSIGPESSAMGVYTDQ